MPLYNPVPVITAWEAYTPTITNASGGMSNYTATGEWRRVGDSMEVRARIVFSATSAAFSSVLVGLPNSKTIDFDKLPANWSRGNVGVGILNETGTAEYVAVARVNSGTTGSVFLLFASALATHAGTAYPYQGAVTEAIPFTWDNNDQMTIQFSVPITGWTVSY